MTLNSSHPGNRQLSVGKQGQVEELRGRHTAGLKMFSNWRSPISPHPSTSVGLPPATNNRPHNRKVQKALKVPPELCLTLFFPWGRGDTGLQRPASCHRLFSASASSLLSQVHKAAFSNPQEAFSLVTIMSLIQNFLAAQQGSTV